MLSFLSHTNPFSGDAVRTVVVAPHADDEVLGCGGLLAKYPGDSAVVVLAQTSDTRAKELKQAQEILGYSAAYLFNFDDGYLGEDARALTTLLDRVVNELQPEQLYLPYPSLHQDHIAAYEAGLRASRLSMNSAHHFTPNVYVYDVSAYDTNLVATDLRWNTFLALAEEHIDKKVEALHCYDSQVVAGPHPVNGLKETAYALGGSRKVEYAEKFCLVREVR